MINIFLFVFSNITTIPIYYLLQYNWSISRLFCAKFSTTSLTACQSSFNYFASMDSSSSTNDDNVKLEVNSTGFGLAVAFVLLAAVLLVPVIWTVYWYACGKQRASRLDSTNPVIIVDNVNPVNPYK